MSKEKNLYEKIVKKFSDSGEKLYSSERSIMTKIETLLGFHKEGEEFDEDVFVEQYYPLFKTDSDNVRHDTSVGIKSYIDKNPYKNGTSDETTKTEDNSQNDRLSELERRLNDMVAKENIAAKRKSLMSGLESKGVEKEWLNTMVEGISFDENFDVESNVEKYEALYNKMKGTISPTPTPYEPKTPDEDIAKSFEYIRKAREKRINQNKTEN